MMPIRLSEIARIVGGTLDVADAEVSGPAFLDSRDPETGGLFVALAGEHADAHAYAGDAVAGGAAGVLGSRPTGWPTVVVPDVSAALATLAREVLARRRAAESPLGVVALTGSSGKTSTKDLLAAVLGQRRPTVATHASFNNELGLPLTVLRIEPHTRYAVLEMGARGVGHLTRLCAIAPPDVSVVLNVGRAHLGEFGSVEAIAQGKGELVEALDERGTAVLNADDPRVIAMRSRTRAPVLRFGRAESAEVRIGPVALDDLGRPSFDLTYAGVTRPVALPVIGAHHAANAAAAVAAAVALGEDFAETVAALSRVRRLSRWRMEPVDLPGGTRLINDAYNANPESMRAALETLADIGGRVRAAGGRTVAVLGEMRELGDSSYDEHHAVGALVRRLAIDHLIVVGDGAQGILDGAQAMAEGWGSPLHARDVHEAARMVGETVRTQDVVLVKASRGVALERVVDELLEGPEG